MTHSCWLIYNNPKNQTKNIQAHRCKKLEWWSWKTQATHRSCSCSSRRFSNTFSLFYICSGLQRREQTNMEKKDVFGESGIVIITLKHPNVLCLLSTTCFRVWHLYIIIWIWLPSSNNNRNHCYYNLRESELKERIANNKVTSIWSPAVEVVWVHREVWTGFY